MEFWDGKGIQEGLQYIEGVEYDSHVGGITKFRNCVVGLSGLSAFGSSTLAFPVIVFYRDEIIILNQVFITDI